MDKDEKIKLLEKSLKNLLMYIDLEDSKYKIRAWKAIRKLEGNFYTSDSSSDVSWEKMKMRKIL